MSDIIYEHGIILSSEIVGEADRSLSVLLDNSEKIKAIARSSAKISSKLGMHLLAGDEVSVGLVEGKNSLVIVSAEKINRFANQEESIRLNFLMRICKMLDDFFLERDAHSGLFDFTFELFQKLPLVDERTIKQFYIFSVLRILNFAGLLPELDKCLECGKLPHVFSVASGGALCSAHKSKNDAELTDKSWKFLQKQKEGFFIFKDLSEKEIMELQNVLDTYVDESLRSLRGF